MLMIVTGAVGVGKTTVCQKTVDMARSRGFSVGGILTFKASDEGIVIEDVQTGQTMRLASTQQVYTGPHTGRYYFNPEGIAFGNRAIGRGQTADILVVDEMGHLELRGEGFASAIELVRSKKLQNRIAVIRSDLLPLYLPILGGAPLVFETTKDNRDQLPTEIALKLSPVGVR